MSTSSYFALAVGFLPVRLSVDLRHLLLATWTAEEEAIAAVLPRPLRPHPLEGRQAVSAASFRVVGGRLGRLPVPPYRQLNVRVYTSWQGEPAVYFLTARTSALGLGGALFGAPYRLGRLSVEAGRTEAPGLGLSLRYRPAGPGEPGALARHELGLFEGPDGRLRAFRVRRGDALWRAAEPTAAPVVDLLVAYGLDPEGPPGLVYAERAAFTAELPVEKLGEAG